MYLNPYSGGWQLEHLQGIYVFILGSLIYIMYLYVEYNLCIKKNVEYNLTLGICSIN